MAQRRRRPNADPSTLPVIGYLRVSTEEQAASGAGIDAQRAAITAEADRRGWGDRLEWLTDEGYSAKNLQRPAIADALERLAAGEAGTLVVSKLDRLSRSLLDFAGLMARAEREGWHLVALDLGVDTSSPQGEMVAHVMASFAQFERKLIGARTRDALAAKRRAGVRLGRPPEVAAPVAERIRAARAAGASYRAIADELNAEQVPTVHGGAQWWPGTVRAIVLAQDAEQAA